MRVDYALFGPVMNERALITGNTARPSPGNSSGTTRVAVKVFAAAFGTLSDFFVVVTVAVRRMVLTDFNAEVE